MGANPQGYPGYSPLDNLSEGLPVAQAPQKMIKYIPSKTGFILAIGHTCVSWFHYIKVSNYLFRN